MNRTRFPAVTRTALLVFAIALLAMAPAQATKYVKWDSPGPAHDGTSWCTAFQTIQEALDVAGDGEMVKVAQGTYAEKIVFKTGAILQGGFRANTPPCPPSAPDSTRDPATYVTIIDGGGNVAGSRTVTSYANGSLDGFVIRGAETVVYISTAFTVTNNIIEAGGKYGIYWIACSPIVTGNTVDGLGTGKIGMFCTGKAYCSGYDPVCLACGGSVSNNTVLGWTDNAVDCTSQYAGCTWGSCLAVCNPTFTNNDLSGGIATVSIGSSTPAFTGNRITGSPGGDVAVSIYDCSPTITGNTIQALAKIGIECVAQAYCSGYDASCQTCTASITGNSISEATQYGIYCEAQRVSCTWGSCESNCRPTLRDNTISGSGIDGIRCRRAVPVITANTISDSGQCGIYGYNDVSTSSMSSLTIDGNIIERQVKGIYCHGSTVSPTVKNNTVRMSKEESILCDGGSAATVTDNTLIGGTTGVNCLGTSTTATSPKVHRNIIIGARIAGIVCRYSASEVFSNLIRNGSKTGISTQGGTAKIWNNTIVKNPWYGIHVEFGTPDVRNSIITGSAIGVFADGGIPTLGSNDLWDNMSDYEGVTAAASDIAVDPMFLAPAVGEYHLKPGSLCIGAGDNTKAGSTKDLDYKNRILPAEGTVDIGCCEWDDTPYWIREPGQAKTIDPQYTIRMKPEVVTAAWTDTFYIEDDGQSSGILVAKDAHGLTGANQRADVTGTIATNADGEVFLQASAAAASGTGTLSPVFTICRNIGGGSLLYPGTSFGQPGIPGSTGANNIGLLVRVCGLVTEVEPSGTPTWFKIDDGNGRAIKCVATGGDPAISASWQDKHAVVTGISSCELDGATLVSKIKLRTGETPLIY